MALHCGRCRGRRTPQQRQYSGLLRPVLPRTGVILTSKPGCRYTGAPAFATVLIAVIWRLTLSSASAVPLNHTQEGQFEYQDTHRRVAN